MGWYETKAFGENLDRIENFLVEIAAHENWLLMKGLRRAHEMQVAQEGMQALSDFVEQYSAFRRIAPHVDKAISRDVDQREAEGKLNERLPLIFLHLRMARARDRRFASATLERLASLVSIRRRRLLFGDEAISLQKTVINVGHLRGAVKIIEELQRVRSTADDAILKPTNIDSNRVIGLIDKAIDEIRVVRSLSSSQRAQVEAYLQEAKSEVLDSRPSWPRIIGALMIVAAITSGLADAPQAAMTIKQAVEYILGTSVDVPSQQSLPAPERRSDSEESSNFPPVVTT